MMTIMTAPMTISDSKNGYYNNDKDDNIVTDDNYLIDHKYEKMRKRS